MRCPECGATANDNKCLIHGKIGIIGKQEPDIKSLEVIKEQQQKIEAQAITIKDLGEKLNAKK